ncbi:MAG: RecX family transcriptional regulator [Porphyrobacter sp.]|jgi:regulatory protein|nr:RecX family transcriptional regulator [Porphyrobacter sp.]
MVSGKANSSSRGSDQPPSDRGGERRRERRERGTRRPARLLDQAALHDLALSYVARFATTGAKLEAYLVRKLRERGQAGDDADGEGAGDVVDIPALVARMIDLGYVDDAAYARMRARDLAARGFGARRIEQALWVAGVDEPTRADHTPGEAARRAAAVRFAEKRRLGPFGAPAPQDDPLGAARAREKAVAAMLRAGHGFAHARFVLDAASRDDIADWLAEAAADDDEGTDERW